MNFLKVRLNEDEFNIELRHYYLIQLILNEKWNETLNLLEQTPSIHSNLIQFQFKCLSMKIENIFRESNYNKSAEFSNKEESFVCYNKNDRSYSSSSLNSIESFHQNILFSSKGKFYKKKSFNWIQMGKGECEIFQNSPTEIFIRLWIVKNSSIKLVLLVNIIQLDHFSLLSTKMSSLTIQFQAKNQCDYPLSNHFNLYKLKFNSMFDFIQLKTALTLR
ncbi:unnamed protein product [Rotaria socialis]|uniref:Uncharacterized protein n=1 Tax=Rotaria socialis TaxID=392032 RepID=A0A820F3F0_9BILA|nr:unnamed protein product [Rotaria socialis]CAF3469408.1 unnamed protein product [Rotaria socialis]CAF4256675.1 unnamed protein product [Rotaria socialis]CAF4403512.1 unnamed protein product [Rotaria socialis]CAF4483685.1 unnamed protein product [Rotaria socialis]